MESAPKNKCRASSTAMTSNGLRQTQTARSSSCAFDLTMKKTKPEHRREYWKYHVAASLVPGELLSVHNMLLQMRNRIFAHHDKDARITDTDTGVDLFQLVVVVDGGEMRPGVQMVFPTESQLGKVQELCDHLYRICMHKGHEALIRCIGDALRDGIYRVTTEFEGRAHPC